LQEKLTQFLTKELDDLKQKGLYRVPKILESEQGGRVRMDGRTVVMFSSNNYLGLASHPEVKRKTAEAIQTYGCGTASGPQTAGTTRVHVELARKVAEFTNCEAALLFNSCTSANIGLLTTITTDKDVILSDQYNHASIIDGCRLSRAETKVYNHNDMKELEKLLKDTQNRRLRIIITDGVFSMEGDLAPIPELVELAKKYDAVLVVDDSHATGVMGKEGRGTPEHFGLKEGVDVQTSTFGKAVGASAGGYVAGKKELVDYLYNRTRAFIFTNGITPAVAVTAIAALDILGKHPELKEKLFDNTRYFKRKIVDLGFEVIESETPILPIIIGDSALAIKMSNELFDEGVFIKGFTYPAVPLGKARLRAQISAAHTRDDLDMSVGAFERIGKKLKVFA
jgi:glycine C-acetyltransferase